MDGSCHVHDSIVFTCVYMCLCVCARVRVCVCVCMCHGLYRWIATPIYEWPKRHDEVAQILDDFEQLQEGVGDRRQEVVYIGIDMDRGAIEALLDECLLTDDEMLLYNAQMAGKDNLVDIQWSATPPNVVGVPGFLDRPRREHEEEESEEEEEEEEGGC